MEENTVTTKTTQTNHEILQNKIFEAIIGYSYFEAKIALESIISWMGRSAIITL